MKDEMIKTLELTAEYQVNCELVDRIAKGGKGVDGEELIQEVKTNQRTEVVDFGKDGKVYYLRYASGDVPEWSRAPETTHRLWTWFCGGLAGHYAYLSDKGFSPVSKERFHEVLSNIRDDSFDYPQRVKDLLNITDQSGVLVVVNDNTFNTVEFLYWEIK